MISIEPGGLELGLVNVKEERLTVFHMLAPLVKLYGLGYNPAESVLRIYRSNLNDRIAMER